MLAHLRESRTPVRRAIFASRLGWEGNVGDHPTIPTLEEVRHAHTSTARAAGARAVMAGPHRSGVRRRGRRRRGDGCRGRAGRSDPRPPRAARRAAGLRLRDVLAQLQALPRWSALPGAAELLARARGPARARAHAHPDRAAPGQAGPLPLPPPAPAVGAPLRHGGADALRLDGRRPLGAASPAAEPAQGAAARTGTAQGRPGRGAAVLRRPGRRRAAHDDGRAHGCVVRRHAARARPR